MTKKRERRGAHRATDADLIERFFAERTGHDPVRIDDRKSKQVGREVHRVLSQALADLADPRLASAFLIEVRPAPDASRFAALVSAGSGATVSEVMAGLQAARGHLRGELAASLTRKRIPDLAFEVVP